MVLSSSSGGGMPGGLPAGDPAEDSANGQAEAGQVAGGEDVAGHDLAGGVQVADRRPRAGTHAGQLVDREAHVGEGDTRPQRVGVEGRYLDPDCPVALGRVEANGAAVIEESRVEGTAWPNVS